MSQQRPNQLAIPIDPEFAEVYAQAARQNQTGQSDNVSREPEQRPKASHTQSPEDDQFRAFEEFAEIAERNRRNSIDRKTLAPGSFDQIEHDFSNTIKLGWDFLTRP